MVADEPPCQTPTQRLPEDPVMELGCCTLRENMEGVYLICCVHKLELTVWTGESHISKALFNGLSLT